MRHMLNKRMTAKICMKHSAASIACTIIPLAKSFYHLLINGKERKTNLIMILI